MRQGVAQCEDRHSFVQEHIVRSAKMLRRRKAMCQTHWFSRDGEGWLRKTGSLLFRFLCSARLIITGAGGLTCTETC
jgi:hypothetical protein